MHKVQHNDVYELSPSKIFIRLSRLNSALKNRANCSESDELDAKLKLALHKAIRNYQNAYGLEEPGFPFEAYYSWYAAKELGILEF